MDSFDIFTADEPIAYTGIYDTGVNSSCLFYHIDDIYWTSNITTNNMAGAICGKGTAVCFDGVCVVHIVLFTLIVCMFVPICLFLCFSCHVFVFLYLVTNYSSPLGIFCVSSREKMRRVQFCTI